MLHSMTQSENKAFKLTSEEQLLNYNYQSCTEEKTENEPYCNRENCLSKCYKF